MRFLAALVLTVLVVFGAYAGYWFFAAERIRISVEDWQAARIAEGWEAAHSGLAIEGFPRAHSIRAEDFRVAAPPAQGGWSLALSDARLEAAAPWNFNAWTLYPRGGATLRLAGGEDVVLDADDARLRLESERGAVRHFSAEAHDLAVQSAEAPLRAAGSIYAEGDLADGAWSVLFEGRDVQLAERALPEARAAFGGRIAVLALDVRAGAAGLAALAAGGAGLEDAGDLAVNAAHLEWGAAQLSGEGALGVDPDGRLRGTFDVAVADAPAFLGALAGASILDPRQANVALAAAAFFPRDDQDRMILPFSFRGGDTLLGPVAIGPAPLIRNAPGPRS